MKTANERIAILPGSYDPITRGHVIVAERAARLFDRVIVAVMQNPEKQYLFSVEQRLRLAEVSLREIPNCEAIADDGMLIDLYDRLGAVCVVKGLRNETDYRYESVQAEWNRAHLPSFETVYLPSDEDLESVSSTEVRRRLNCGESVSGLLMPAAEELIRTEYLRRS